MADDAELPYGEDASGRLVMADVVPRGDACGCVCPDCRRPFQAHQGPKRSWHFQHKPEPGQPASCTGYAETMLHKLAKQIIGEAGELWLPPLVACYQHHRETVRPMRRVTISDARTEPHLGQIKPDLIVTSGERDLIVEVAVTHKAEPAKLAWLASNERPAIELDLAAGRELAGDALAKFVLREAPRVWLWHRNQLDIDAQLAATVLRRLVEQRERAEREAAAREVERQREAERQAAREVELAAQYARFSERAAAEREAALAAMSEVERQRETERAAHQAETGRRLAEQWERDRELRQQRARLPYDIDQWAATYYPSRTNPPPAFGELDLGEIAARFDRTESAQAHLALVDQAPIRAAIERSGQLRDIVRSNWKRHYPGRDQ